MIRGITFGAFDLLHAGHAQFLMDAGKLCDQLIIGVHTNPALERPDTKNVPIQSVLERTIQLFAIKKVEWVIPYDTELDLCNLLATFPGLEGGKYFLGSDYMGKDLPREVNEVLLAKDIRIHYINRLHNYSSTELRKRIENAKSKSNNRPSSRSAKR